MALLPGLLSLWMGLLTLLPAGGWNRRGRVRSVLASAAVFGAPALSVWVGMAWVTYFDRYVLPFAVMMAALLPIGLARLAGMVPIFVPRSRSFVPLAAASGAVAWALMQWPGVGARSLDAPETVRSSEYHAGVLARWVRDETNGNDHVIDCAGLALDSLLLPFRTNYVRFPPGDSQCVALMSDPPVKADRTFLITMHRDIPPQYRRTDLPFDAASVAALGWTEVGQSLPIDGYKVWQKK